MLHIIRQKFLRPGIRVYRSQNLYDRIIEYDKLEKEGAWLRKRQKKPGKREIRSISLKKQTEKNKKQKTGLTKEEKKRLKELRMIKAENQKKRKPFTAQDTIPYKEI